MVNLYSFFLLILVNLLDITVRTFFSKTHGYGKNKCIYEIKKVDIELVIRICFWNNLHMNDHNQKIGKPNMLKYMAGCNPRGINRTVKVD